MINKLGFKARPLLKFFTKTKELFNLRENSDLANTDALIRANVDFKSANAWTLVFAIFIASIGLNINSTAVIIGAMLISPLMGPIVGGGFALGINDTELLKRCVKNIGYAVAISLVTSTLYFLISPLAEAQTELIARTRPSFYDVMIAFFGGAAGIVAISQKEKGNAIPGVAIATALMPPLCTAGFSIANGEISYFLGALYLFSINLLFIAISTYLFVRYLNFPVVAYAAAKDRRTGNIISYLAAIAIIPSLVTAWYLQRETSFKADALRFAKQEIRALGLLVISENIDFTFKSSTVTFKIVGEKISDDEIAAIKNNAEKYNLEQEQIKIEFVSLTANLENEYQGKLNSSKATNQQISSALDQAKSELSNLKDLDILSDQLTNEAQLISKNVVKIELAKILASASDEKSSRTKIIWVKKPKNTERENVEKFIELRTGKINSCCMNLVAEKEL